MNNVNEFVERLVKVEFIESSECFGHYPFQICSKTKDGSLRLGALALGGDVVSCYRALKKELEEGCTEIFLSLDFPANGDIENDFVAVFSVVNGLCSLFAIPYDQDGNILERITKSKILDQIFEEFKNQIS